MKPINPHLPTVTNNGSRVRNLRRSHDPNHPYQLHGEVLVNSVLWVSARWSRFGVLITPSNLTTKPDYNLVNPYQEPPDAQKTLEALQYEDWTIEQANRRFQEAHQADQPRGEPAGV